MLDIETVALPVSQHRGVTLHVLQQARLVDQLRAENARRGAHDELLHLTLERLRLGHATQADVAHGWKRILGTVRTYADLEPSLLARVEELIDFVTAPAAP